MIYNFKNAFKSMESGQTIEAHVWFDFYRPEDKSRWQYEHHGSLSVIDVISDKSQDDISVLELIQIRRACWDYLEMHQLYEVTH